MRSASEYATMLSGQCTMTVWVNVSVRLPMLSVSPVFTGT